MDPYPEAEREPLFEKPLTPSDVGKLNRLVIPKHHAEKHFPLGVDLAERGLLLSFEDESERQWLFRYSYWSSSQSYVLTKGWSGFVKDKQLDAGDVVSFQKHRVEDDRLLIRWRRSAAPARQPANGGGDIAMYYGQQLPYPPPFPPGFPHAGGGSVSGEAAVANGGRRVRLFGVNLDSDPRPPMGKITRRHGFGSEHVGAWDGSSSSSSASWS